MARSAKVAYFISPHGYGHAARASAVMLALQAEHPNLAFEIYTRVPRWFFDHSHLQNFTYHKLLTDIGLAQQTSLEEDLPETIRRLAAFIPFDANLVSGLARELRDQECSIVLCDISPLGLAVAHEAGLPSVLIENFTWDWIYQGYAEQEKRIETYIQFMQESFSTASYHIQTYPMCQFKDEADLHTPPVSRPWRTPPEEIRRELEVTANENLLMLTMGGIPWEYEFLDSLQQMSGVTFIIPGGSETPTRRKNLVLLPHHNRFFHPDLVKASNGVIGKLGYSTLAEVFQAGVPYGYIARSGFRESRPLAAYVDAEMVGLPISAAAFTNGTWLAYVPKLLHLPRQSHEHANGATLIAHFVAHLLAL